MCGYGPAVSMLIAANVLGAQRAELVRYATSADASGDRDQVVGYAGIIVEVRRFVVAQVVGAGSASVSAKNCAPPT